MHQAVLDHSVTIVIERNTCLYMQKEAMCLERQMNFQPNGGVLTGLSRVADDDVVQYDEVTNVESHEPLWSCENGC
jgi:hypothetical protein